MNHFRSLMGYFISALLILFAAASCTTDKANASYSPDNDSLINNDSIIEASIVWAGDLMCHSPQFTHACIADSQWDFRGNFEYVRPVIASADLAISNLETVCGGNVCSFRGYPRFNTPDAYLDGIKWAGFDFLTTSNNHTMDQGEKGVLRTIRELDKRRLGYTGSFHTAEDRDSIRILDANGIKLALVSYTYGTNGLPAPEDKPWMVNLIDTSLMRKDIRRARKSEADLVAVYFHFGKEYGREPDTYQKQYVNFAKEFGADLIIGGHPHVVQPAQFFATSGQASLDTGFIAWSLGNFLSNQDKPYTQDGVILRINLLKNTNSGELKITSIEYLPTWVYRGALKEEKLHRIIPSQWSKLDIEPEYLDEKRLKQMSKSFDDTYSNFIRYEPRFRLIEVAKPDSALKDSVIGTDSQEEYADSVVRPESTEESK